MPVSKFDSLELSDTSRPAWQSTAKPNKQVKQEDTHQYEQRHQLDVLPPHLSPQSPAPDSEIMRIASQPIRLVDQQINPLTTLQQALDILAHYPPHIINLTLNIRNRILLSRLRRPIANHQLLQLGVKAASPIVRQTREVGAFRWVDGLEAFLDFDEESEGDASPERGVGDYEVGEAAGGVGGGGVLAGTVGDVVDEVGAVDVGQLSGGFVADFGEDD